MAAVPSTAKVCSHLMAVIEGWNPDEDMGDRPLFVLSFVDSVHSAMSLTVCVCAWYKNLKTRRFRLELGCFSTQKIKFHNHYTKVANSILIHGSAEYRNINQVNVQSTSIFPSN